MNKRVMPERVEMTITHQHLEDAIAACGGQTAKVRTTQCLFAQAAMDVLGVDHVDTGIATVKVLDDNERTIARYTAENIISLGALVCLFDSDQYDRVNKRLPFTTMLNKKML